MSLVRFVPVVAALAMLVTCAGSPCGKCGPGTECDEMLGECVVKMDSPVCVPGCTGKTPVCDSEFVVPRCVVCTETQGCSGVMNHCDTSVTGGRCITCTHGNCGDAGTAGESDGGVDGGTRWDAGEYSGPNTCAPHDGGVQTCSTTCKEGFHCEVGDCVLNGNGGPVQVTLRWNAAEDLDLHVDEPVAGSPCELWYGRPNRNHDSLCGAVGSLDLDSNAGCFIDDVDIENVIYPPGSTAPSGTYNVRVDYYENCDATLTGVPFEVEARYNGQTSGMCGLFLRTEPEWSAMGGSGAGRLVMSFTVP